jgi:hypothetical protein
VATERWAERAPVQKGDLVVLAGALVGLALVLGAGALLVPIRGAIDAVRGEGAVARALERRAPAPEDADAAFSRADEAVARAFGERRAALEPVLAGRRSGVGGGLAALRAWGELKLAWARAIAATGLTPAAWREHARRRGERPYDRLVGG